MSALFWIVVTNSRDAPNVASQPRVSLRDWRVVQTRQGMNLVGFLSNGVTCRVTTSIVDINLPAREVRTSSWRLYELMGPPTTDPTKLAVISFRLRQTLPCVDADVTSDIWSDMQAATS